MLTVRILTAVAVAAILAGCNSEDPFELPTNPTPPTQITETFSGNVTRNGAVTHQFATQASGRVTATLTGFSADEGTKIGLALGTFNGASCQVVIAKDDATLATAVVGEASAAGLLCVRIYDVGNLTQAADYEIQLQHY
jgi:hypothetical protein